MSKWEMGVVNIKDLTDYHFIYTPTDIVQFVELQSIYNNLYMFY